MHFNAAIDACGKSGRWEEALSLLREMACARQSLRCVDTLAVPQPYVRGARNSLLRIVRTWGAGQLSSQGRTAARAP